MATDPAVDDQPHPADSEHLVPPFFAHLGRKRTHEVGERALSEQFLLGRYRIGSAIPDERRLELLAGGRPLFPQELRRSWQLRVTSAHTPDPELAPHRLILRLHPSRCDRNWAAARRGRSSRRSHSPAVQPWRLTLWSTPFGQATIYPSPDCSGASRHRTRIELLQRTATAPT